MLHNLDARTVYSMNGVWWTLAVEEQLYLLYFVLLWMRRKWGWAVVLTTTFLLRFVVLGVSLAFHQMGVDIPFSESALSNWWIWALGALSVEAYMGIVRLPRLFYSLTFAAAILIAAGGLFHAGIVSPGTIVSQAAAVFTPLLWGLAFFTIVNRCVRDGLGLRSLAFVGLFSYSLYLTHEFVIRVVPFGLLIGFSISLAFAYAFFRLFEKPFMKSADHKSRSGTRTGIDSFDTSPA